MQRHDVMIIGRGQAGRPLSWRLARRRACRVLELGADVGAVPDRMLTRGHAPPLAVS